MMRLSHTLALATVLAFAAACSNPETPTAPDLSSRDATNAITCNVSVTANSMNCDSPNPNARSGPNYSVSLGGQNSLVQLAATGTAYNNPNFTTTVTVKNLTVQPMGTANGSVADTGGVKVFFYSGPTCTVGGGTATVTGNDGTATFTGAGQKYYKYAGNLAPNGTTAGKTWTVALATGCTAFTFQVLVNAVLPAEHAVLKWDSIDAGTTEDLTGVSVGGSNEVWVTGAHGTIRHWNGNAWGSQASGHTVIPIRAVEMHGGPPVRGIAVGDSGTILFYNGSAWADVLNHGTAGILNVSKVGQDLGNHEWWACGGGGAIFHTTDSSGATGWAQSTSNTAADLHVCGGGDINNVYAIGSGGTITHWAGSAWSTSGYTSGTTKNLFSATGGGSSIFAAGDDGTIVSTPESPGTTFTPMTSPVSTGITLYGGESGDAGNAYFVGYNGTILYLNDAGNTWLVAPSGTTTTLNDISVRGGGGQEEAWVVGNHGLVLHGHR